MLRIAIALIIAGCFVLFLGFKEMRLSLGSSSTPTRLSVEEIAKNGAGDNRYVTLTGYMLSNSYVAHYKNKDDQSRFETVYVPVVSSKSPYAKQVAQHLLSGKGGDSVPELKDEFPVLLKSSKLHTDEELFGLMGQDGFDGMVINSVESLGSKEAELIQQSYPKANMDKLVIIEHGRSPTGVGMLLVYFAGGLALIGGGGFMGWKSLAKTA